MPSEFFQTVMGQQFYTNTVPQLVQNVGRIAKAVETLASRLPEVAKDEEDPKRKAPTTLQFLGERNGYAVHWCPVNQYFFFTNKKTRKSFYIEWETLADTATKLTEFDKIADDVDVSSLPSPNP